MVFARVTSSELEGKGFGTEADFSTRHLGWWKQSKRGDCLAADQQNLFWTRQLDTLIGLLVTSHSLARMSLCRRLCDRFSCHKL